MYLIPSYACGCFSPMKNVGFFEIFGIYILYYLAALSLAYMLSTFFNNPKLASDLITMILSLLSLSFLLVYSQPFCSHEIYVFLISVLPNAALQFGFVGSGFINPGGYTVVFTLGNASIMLAFDLILFFGLYIYLDQVMGGEYGQKKHLCFCLKRKSR